MNRSFLCVPVSKRVCWGLVLIVLGTATLGCEPLRKKFVRKKKKERIREVIPVLEPVEYPRQEYSADSLYRQHYSLWKVWFKDLMVAMAEGDSDKRIRHILGELTLQLRHLQPLVDESKRLALDALMEELGKIGQAYEKPAALRNDLILRNKARALDRTFREGFAYSKMKESLSPAVDAE